MNFEKSSPTPTPSIVVSWRGSLIGTHVVSGQLAFLYDSSCLYLPGLRIELNYIKEVVVSSTSHAPKDPWGWYIYLHERLIFMGSSCRYIYRSSHGSSGYFNLSSTFHYLFGSSLSPGKPSHCDEDSRCLTWGTWGTFEAPNRTWTFNNKKRWKAYS